MVQKPYQDPDWLREKYHDEGLTGEQMAELANCSRTTIYKYMREHDVPRDRGEGYRVSEPERYRDEEWLKEKYLEQNLSSAEIAELCDCTRQCILHWLHKHNISIREKSEAIKNSWVGDEKRKHAQAEWMKQIRQPWWDMDEETQQRVRERFSEWWSENNPMEGKTKEQNPAWKGGGNRKYYGPNWDEQREKALERDNHCCQRCNASEDLVVHHHIPIRHWRDSDERNIENANQLWNLATLCDQCHGAIEGRRLKND